MTQKPETPESFDNLNNLYEKLGSLELDFRNKNLNDLLVSMLRPGSVLDIGCGAGHLLAKARQKGHAVTGVEPHKPLVEYAENLYGKDINIKQMFAEDIDKLEGRFDNITMIDILEHVENDSLILQKLHKLLSKDGQLIVLVPHHPHLYGKRDIAIGHFRRYTSKGLKAVLEANDFRLRSSRIWNMMGYFPYFFYEKVLRKEINLAMRTKKAKNPVVAGLNKFLQIWFKHVENNVSFGFGLSLITVSTKKDHGI